MQQARGQRIRKQWQALARWVDDALAGRSDRAKAHIDSDGWMAADAACYAVGGTWTDIRYMIATSRVDHLKARFEWSSVGGVDAVRLAHG